MSLLNDLTAPVSGFSLSGALPYQRLRARRVPDPYNPAQTVLDWTTPDVLDLAGALASASSVRTPDARDVQTTSSAYLTVADPTVDVRVGDRIRPMPDDGRCWEVTGFPSRDQNGFTGWQPTLEIALTEWKG